MRLGHRNVVVAGVTIGLVMMAAPAAAKGGEIEGAGDRYNLTNGWDGAAHRSFAYGRSDDRVYVGNFDGRGTDTLAVRRGDRYHIRNSLSAGAADRIVIYGREDDEVFMGDWDGDGVDTPVVRRGNTYYFKNSLSGGKADVVVDYGRADDVVLVGDWNGDGTDTLAVRRGHEYYVKNSIRSGVADTVVKYGRPGDEVVVGNWNGNRGDTLGVRRGNAFYIKNTIAGGPADVVMQFGRAGDGALVGDWTGNGADTIGLRSTRAMAVAPPAGSMAAYDARMIELINAERAAVGAPPVREVPALRAAALRHSSWMAGVGRIQHAARATINADAEAVGCIGGGEHIVRTWQTNRAPDPRDAIDWYMNSPVHRAGIINPNNRFVAVGTVEAGNYVYNTQRFSRSCS